jgi:hypothetical protein
MTIALRCAVPPLVSPHMLELCRGLLNQDVPYESRLFDEFAASLLASSDLRPCLAPEMT